jgi:hypothetical protein
MYIHFNFSINFQFILTNFHYSQNHPKFWMRQSLKFEIVICTTSYESHTIFHEFAVLINDGVARVNQANE